MNHERRKLLLAAAGALCAGAPGQAAAPPLSLSVKGASRYVITLADDATASEKTAARELAEYLHHVTGAVLPIRAEAEVKPEAPQVLVGAGRRARQLLPGVDWKALGHDGIVLKTVGPHIILAGGRPRGTLYAVYAFLEDVVGCRWWTSREQDIPRKPTLSIPTLDTFYVPRFRYREAYYGDVMRREDNGVFAAHLRLNGHHDSIAPERGGHYNILGWCHTFYPLLPPEKYFAPHPEWYSEINGKRTTSNAQLCLTNEAMRAEMTRVVRERIAKNPDAGMISVSQNDCFGYCQCVNCRALEQAEGAPSGPLIHFVNAIAADVGKDYPDFLFETLAYQWSRKPPKHVRPAANVIVRLADIEASFAQPLDSDNNRGFRDDLNSWAAVAPNLFVWDYVTNFGNYLVPHPNWPVLAPNLRFFGRNNVIGVFEQGDGFNTAVGDFLPLRAWLMAHLLWDPARDPRALTREFLRGYYGAGAAPPLEAYLDLVNTAHARQNAPLSCYNGDHSYLTNADLDEATRLFDAAQAASGSPVHARRIRRERLTLDHLRLLRYPLPEADATDEGQACADYNTKTTAFIEDARAFGVVNASEGQGFAPYAAGLRMRCERLHPPRLPAASAVLSPGSFDIQETAFRLARPGVWASLVDDPKASDGRAARMPGEHTQWAVQFSVPEGAPYAGPGPWRCYVVVRCAAKAKSGAAFTYGLYEPKTGAFISMGTATLEGTSDGAYHSYGIYVDELRPGMYFWVAPPGNSATVEAVYVDRIFLMRDANKGKS